VQNNDGRCIYYQQNLKRVGNGNKSDNWRFGGDDGARDRTDRTRMRVGGSRIQIGAEMELRREKDNPEEQSKETELLRLAGHPITQMELRL
jgi:hypothetical protein